MRANRLDGKPKWRPVEELSPRKFRQENGFAKRFSGGIRHDVTRPRMPSACGGADLAAGLVEGSEDVLGRHVLLPEGQRNGGLAGRVAVVAHRCPTPPVAGRALGLLGRQVLHVHGGHGLLLGSAEKRQLTFGGECPDGV